MIRGMTKKVPKIRGKSHLLGCKPSSTNPGSLCRSSDLEPNIVISPPYRLLGTYFLQYCEIRGGVAK
jgi:hypothetical protein